MKKNYKNQKGISLISLSIAVIVLLVIVGTVLYNVRTNLGLQRVKSMQADIENLRGKVSNYYLQYGSLPILNRYDGNIKRETEIDSSVISDVVNNATNNQLDTGDYYVIDLKAMDNITLTYGEDYEKLKDETAENIQNLKNGTLTDIYIINSVSHNIFYVAGITYDGKTYYTQYQDEEKEKIGESNFDIDLENRVERDSKGNLIYKIDKGESAPGNRNAVYIDENDNRAVIPAGFTVSDEPGESSIETGLVIKDSDENEFVWIPVGEVKYVSNGISNTKTINLARYYFQNGTISSTILDGSARKLPSYKSLYTEDEKKTSYKNAIAKDINTFITKTKQYGGYYIGRYEARVSGYEGSVKTSNSENEQNWTGYTNGKLVEKPKEQVYNYITQNKASELSINMYPENNYFQSDLVNSYAWDTATLFLQEFDNRSQAVKNNERYNSHYSIQSSLWSNSGVRTKGSSDINIEESTIDKICNIYDMSANCFEFTTETCNNDNEPCVKRGAMYNSGYTSFVSTFRVSSVSEYSSFRPILYLK